MCTSTLSAGPPIQLPLGQTLIPAKPNPQPQAASAQNPSSPAQALAQPTDPHRGKALDVAV